MAFILYLYIMAAAQNSGHHTLNLEQQGFVDSWLRRHPDQRLADVPDCDCGDDISSLKSGYGGAWPKIVDYHPYRAIGDFNGDGATDIAIVVIDRSKAQRPFTLLVFNGPFGKDPPNPSFEWSDLDLKGHGLFYGPPRSKPYRLVVGRFEAEGTIVAPQGKTYKTIRPPTQKPRTSKP